MFTRRAATEILPCNENRRPAISGFVQRKRRIGLTVRKKPPVEKKKFTETGALDTLEKLFRNDLIGVDVWSIERGDQSSVTSKGIHYLRRSLIILPRVGPMITSLVAIILSTHALAEINRFSSVRF